MERINRKVFESKHLIPYPTKYCYSISGWTCLEKYFVD